MKSIIWGVFLVVLGSLLLLERFGGLRVPEGTLWPLIIFAVGAGQFAAGCIGTGVMFTLIGTVFLACTLGWFGMTYAHSWPLLMVAAGTGMVIRALWSERWHRIPEEARHD